MYMVAPQDSYLINLTVPAKKIFDQNLIICALQLLTAKTSL